MEWLDLTALVEVEEEEAEDSLAAPLLVPADELLVVVAVDVECASRTSVSLSLSEASLA